MSCKESAIILFSNDVVNEMTLAKKCICNVVVCFVFHGFFCFARILFPLILQELKDAWSENSLDNAQ